MHPISRARCAAALAAAPVLAVLLTGLLTRATHGPPSVPRAVADVVEVVVSAAAAGSFASRMRFERLAGRRWVSPALFALACLLWCCGQVVWTVYEVVLDRPNPTPSLADVGFTGFYAAACLAMSVVVKEHLRGSSAARAVVDALVVAAAMLTVSWTLLLSPMLEALQGQRVLLVVHSIYPIADVFVLSLAVVVISRTGTDRRLWLVTAGTGLLALTDSTYIYLATHGEFATGGPNDVAWTAAFVLLALAARSQHRPEPAALGRFAQRLPFVLPYVPVVAAGALVVTQEWRGAGDPFSVTMMAVVGVAVLGRQGLLVRENTSLLLLSDRRGRQLQRVAYTDALTGIANRLAFTEHLERAAGGDGGTVAAFCDLDRFKAVNDLCGHATGDALLIAVAARLRAVVRADDVVARLGGDEFVVLAAGEGEAAHQVGSRIRAALASPFSGDPAFVRLGLGEDARTVVDRVTASVGIVCVGEVGGDAEEVMRVADERMYEVKRSRSTPAPLVTSS